MIKQELDLLEQVGFMGITDKKQVIEAALEDCRQSLSESYDLIKTLRHYHHRSEKVLDNITISLTILKLMKEES